MTEAALAFYRTSSENEYDPSVTSLHGSGTYLISHLARKILNSTAEKEGRILPNLENTTDSSTPSSQDWNNSSKTRYSQVLPENLSMHLIARLQPIVSFHPVQEWDGYVVEIYDDVFVARITDLTQVGPEDAQEVEIPIEELSDRNRQILEINRLFRWSIGYERTRGGQRKRVSKMIFRDLPAWTKKEIEDDRAKSINLLENIKWEKSDS